MPINKTTLVKKSADGEKVQIFPKTYADAIQYNDDTTMLEKIENISSEIKKVDSKFNNVIDNDNILTMFKGLSNTVINDNIAVLHDTVKGAKLLVFKVSDPSAEVVFRNKNMYDCKDSVTTTGCKDFIVSNGIYRFTCTGDTELRIGRDNDSSDTAYNASYGSLIPYMPAAVSISNTNFDNNMVSYYNESKQLIGIDTFTSNTFIIDGTMEDAKYFTLSFASTIYNTLTDQDMTLKVQVEYGTYTTDYVTPEENTDGQLYDGGTVIMTTGRIEVSYIPAISDGSGMKF